MRNVNNGANHFRCRFYRGLDSVNVEQRMMGMWHFLHYWYYWLRVLNLANLAMTGIIITWCVKISKNCWSHIWNVSIYGFFIMLINLNPVHIKCSLVCFWECPLAEIWIDSLTERKSKLALYSKHGRQGREGGMRNVRRKRRILWPVIRRYWYGDAYGRLG